MLRSLVVVAVLVAVCLGSGITLQCGPAAAPKVLEALAASSGEKLVCGKELRQEILVIRVVGAAWPDLKARVAQVVDGEWEKRRDEWVLTRAAAKDREFEEADLKVRANRFQEIIDQRFQEVQPWSKGYLTGYLIRVADLAEKEHTATARYKSEATNNLDSASSGSPSGRTCARLMKQMSARELAAIPVNGQVIFATTPTPMERSLPQGARAILDEFNSEQTDFATEIEKRTDLYAPATYWDSRLNVSTSNPPGKRILLVCRRYSEVFLQISLMVADADGNRVARSSMSLRIEPKPSETEIEAPQTPIEFSESAKDFEQLYMARSGKFAGDLGDPSKLAELVRRWGPLLSEPRDHEPTSFMAGEALIKSAEGTGDNLIADLPDNLLTWFPYIRWVKKISCKAVLSSLAQGHENFVLHREAGWLTGKPRNPAAAVRQRMFRDPMGKLVATSASRGHVTVDELADYAASQQSDFCFASLDTMYCRITDDSSKSTGSGFGSSYFREPLRFWGALSQEQRSALRNGGTVQFLGLSQAARNRLSEYLYGIPQAYGFTFTTPFTPAEWDLKPLKILTYPHESIPNGVPANTVIRGVPQSHIVLRITMKSGDVSEELAQKFGESRGYENAPLEGEQTDIASLQVGESKFVKIVCDFGGGYSLSCELGDDPSSFGKPVSYADLPDNVKAVVQDNFKKGAARKALLDSLVKPRAIPPR